MDAVCYLDDILVWGTSWDEFVGRLKRILEKLSDTGLALSTKKCKFGVEEVNYLGAVITNGTMCIGQQRTQQLREIPRPTDLAELRRALGAFAYVQRWLPGVADVARPLYDLVKRTGREKLRWNEGCDRAFEKLKDMVANAVALRIPKDGLPFTLVTDASNTGIGAMLAQKEDDTLVPVAFFHHSLSQAERSYNTTEKELLAVVLACKKFRIYLDTPFDLITDHNALKWLNTLSLDDCKGRRARWIEFLQQFEINPVHKRGKSSVMSISDYLSRVTATGDVARL